MIILKHAADVASHIQKFNANNLTVGFVPTMGALHHGHISLLAKSKALCDITVASIFVNPTQFNNADDFKKYPRSLEQDIYLLEKNGCNILFVPDINEIYHDGTWIKKHFDLGYLETILEGKYRPGHFQGVCIVVERLFTLINPTHFFTGQKDYQQCMVLKKLLKIMHSKIHLVICPTQREETGLAMSSRNLRLNDDQKKQASEIYKTLLFIKKNIQPGSLKYLKKNAEEHLAQKNFKIDYVEIADADNLKIVNEWNGSERLIALIAAFVNDVRLIDNVLINDWCRSGVTCTIKL